MDINNAVTRGDRDRVIWSANDVKIAAVAFKAIVTKFNRNTPTRKVVCAGAVRDRANELYFAARIAWRYALKVEGR